MRTGKNITNGRRIAVTVMIGLMAVTLFGCGAAGSGESDVSKAESGAESVLTIGFSQVGEESDWRRANSDNIRSTFTADQGYHLLFDDAQNNPDNQTTAIRNFIQQGVDFIVLEPIIETGWDTVLTEAKEAKIPVIVADRSIDSDPALYTAWVGSDYVREGQMACEWLHRYCVETGIDETTLGIVNIQGTLGSTPQIERERQLLEYAKTYGWNLMASEPGEFVQAKGREAMTKLLTEHPDLNVVYCDNDNEAYGAIEAIEAKGRRAGSDVWNGAVMVISFDATRKGLELVREGKIACNAECNPLHGPRIEKIIREIQNGEKAEAVHYVDESIFAPDETVPEVTIDGKTTRVTRVTEELLNQRVY